MNFQKDLHTFISMKHDKPDTCPMNKIFDTFLSLFVAII